MVKRDGNVAIQHYTENSYNVVVSGVTYAWTHKNHVSLAWVKEEHVPKVLSVKAPACCGKRSKPRFFYASETNVNLHETGAR